MMYYSLACIARGGDHPQLTGNNWRPDLNRWRLPAYAPESDRSSKDPLVKRPTSADVLLSVDIII